VVGSDFSARMGLARSTLVTPKQLYLFWCFPHDWLRVHCLNVHFLRFMSHPIDRIQSPNWNVHKLTGWQWSGTERIPMTIMKYDTSNIWRECKYQSQQNEKRSLQTARAKQQQSDKMLVKTCSVRIWKETRLFTLNYKQQGVINNSQGA
jgi:hypothetical protein